jgi:excisionase family DNA binding protein
MGNAILTTGEAARRTGLSGEYLRQLARAGKIASMRTVTGQYLFEESEISRFISTREISQQQSAASAA